MMPSRLSERLTTPPVIPIPIFRSRFLTGARIKGMGCFIEKMPDDSNDQIKPLRGGDGQALATLSEQHRQRLRRMVELRLDPRLRARLDASDVVQEAFLDVAQRP